MRYEQTVVGGGCANIAIERIKKRKAAKISGETPPAEEAEVKAESSASASGSGKPNSSAKSAFESGE